VINGRIDDNGMIEGNFGQNRRMTWSLVCALVRVPLIKYLEESHCGLRSARISIRRCSLSAISFSEVMRHGVLLPALGATRRVWRCCLESGDLAGVHGDVGAVLTRLGIAGVIRTIGRGVDSKPCWFQQPREGIAPWQGRQLGL